MDRGITKIITTEELLKPHLEYILKLSTLIITPFGDFIQVEYPLYNTNQYVCDILRSIRYEKLVLETFRNINDLLDNLVLTSLLGHKVNVHVTLNVRTYKDTHGHDIYIHHQKKDHYLSAVNEIIDAYLVSDNYSILLLPQNKKVIKHSYGIPIWYTFNQEIIRDIDKQMKKYSTWTWIEPIINIHQELISSFQLESKQFGPFNGKTYLFINMKNTQYNFFLGSKLQEQLIQVMNEMRLGFLPTVVFKANIEQNDGKIYMACILILDTIFSESNNFQIAINKHPRYYDLFNYIYVYNNVIEIPIASLSQLCKFRNMLSSFDFDKIKQYDGNEPIKYHLSLKYPSLYLNDKVMYINDETHEVSPCIDTNNNSDPVTLDEFSEMPLEQLYSVIVIKNDGYLTSSLEELLKKNPYAVLPLNREPFNDVNINLRLRGIIEHHKPGLIDKSKMEFKLSGSTYTLQGTYISLPLPIVKSSPYYSAFALFNISKDDNEIYHDPSGYIIRNGEKVDTPHKLYTIKIDTTNITFICEDDKFDSIYQNFLIKYVEGHFIPIWKLYHPTSKLSFKVPLPIVEDININNDYVISWFARK